MMPVMCMNAPGTYVPLLIVVSQEEHDGRITAWDPCNYCSLSVTHESLIQLHIFTLRLQNFMCDPQW